WADDAKECYELTLQVIQQAMDWFAERTANVPAFGGAKHQSLPADERRAVASRLMPAIRGMVSGQQAMVGHFDDSDAVLEFVNARNMEPLAALGTSCPDHFLRTKIRPLVVAFDPARPDVDATLAGLAGAVAAYRADYAAYYDRCKHPDSPALRDPNAVVYLVPGVGMLTFAKD
ncbi:MAG: bifunctional rhamnulose-1-phosphate aldolase/short-chain dehydrogenase, partial [Lewinella sp.]|nr:bifunctional rhamnulose-1-phosphate aldolase/short-chain dehydrogenase [Lewinella sp.]